MKRFVFRLQIVLDRARRQEEDEVLALAQLRRARYEKEQQADRIVAEQQHIVHFIEELSQDSFDPRELHDCSLKLDALANDLENVRQQINEIDHQIIAQRHRVVEAMRKRKVLERLREKQYEAYLKEVQTMELRMMEEAVNPRISRERIAQQQAISEASAVS